MSFLLPREQRVLVVAGIIVGGLAGIGGGVLVATGRVGSLTRYFPSVQVGGTPSGRMGNEVVRIEEEAKTIDVVRSASPAVVSIVVK